MLHIEVDFVLELHGSDFFRALIRTLGWPCFGKFGEVRDPLDSHTVNHDDAEHIETRRYGRICRQLMRHLK